MNPESTLAELIAADDAQDYDRCLAILGSLTPNQVVDLQAFDAEYNLTILWALAPHWAYAVLYADEARKAPADRDIEPERMPPDDQLHHDRPLAECTDYTPHYHQWMESQVELQQLAHEFKEHLPFDYEAEIARCDDAIATLLPMVDATTSAIFTPVIKQWRNRRADIVADQGGAA